MKVKVCGIREVSNLTFLSKSKVDYVGFIFYDKSKRLVDDGNLTVEDFLSFKKLKVGVFVNATATFVLETIKKYRLDGVQLHGTESVDYCEALQKSGCFVWKAFPVWDVLPDRLEDYEGSVDAFLFDAKGKDLGGNGIQFDWSVLENYKLSTPFILSGGIGAEDAERVMKLSNDRLIGVDVNSRFEVKTGLKDERLLDDFLNKIK